MSRIDLDALDAMRPPASQENSYRRLGLAVIEQAVKDWWDDRCPASGQLAHFLTSPQSKWLAFWCRVAGLDVELIRDGCRRLARS
jgi:hypothetical protein